jgi:hypothetical protein
MNINELARAFVAGQQGKCHNAHTDGRTYVLHDSPIVVKTDTEYQFYWHGYYTKTTAAHMNEVLYVAGAPFRVGYADARRRGEDVFVWRTV